MQKAIKIIPAVIEKVVPSDRQVAREYAHMGKVYEYGNYVTVLDENDVVHIMHNGSLNGIPVEHRKVGVKGYIYWRSQSGYNLPFFVAKSARRRRKED